MDNMINLLVLINVVKIIKKQSKQSDVEFPQTEFFFISISYYSLFLVILTFILKKILIIILQI